MGKWLAVLLMVLLLAGCQGETMESSQQILQENGERKIVVATDIHHLATSLKDDGKAFSQFVAAGDGKLLQYTDELMEVFVSEVKEQRPDVVVLSGDLTNNGEKESHLELAVYLAEIEKAGIPVYVIPGNHDLRNPFALGFEKDQRKRVESVESSEFKEIYRDFGYKEAISRDPNSLSYLVQPADDYVLLMLDTNRYERNLEIGVSNPSGMVREETLEWIQAVLEPMVGMDIVVVMHHNSIPHSEMFIDNYVIDNSEEVMPVLAEFDVSVILSGHIHIQDLMQDPNTGIYDFTTTAMSVYPHRFGVITLKEETISYATETLDVNSYAKRHGWKDPDLLDFDAFAERDFAQRAKDMVLEQLPADLTQEERQKMADVMAELNLAYFAGEEADKKAEIMEMDGFAALRKLDHPFLQHYITSILEDESNDNKIKIQREES